MSLKITDISLNLPFGASGPRRCRARTEVTRWRTGPSYWST